MSTADDRELLSFRPGDMVVLNCGGPNMCVEVPHIEGHVGCVWFDDTRPPTIRREVFLASCLELVPSD